MTKEERIRRAIILCIHFTRNLAFTRAITKNVEHKNEGDFWITLDGNCLDIAVLEWCKLFAEPKGKHCWEKIIDDKDDFKTRLRDSVGLDEYFWKQKIKELRTYRDSFVAHLDNENTMQIPDMTYPKEMIMFLHEELKSKIDASDLGKYDIDLPNYYDDMFSYAEKHLKSCNIDMK